MVIVDYKSGTLPNSH